MGIRQLTAYTEWLERQGIVNVPEGRTHESLAQGFMHDGQPDEALPFNVIDTAPPADVTMPGDSRTDWPEE